MQRQCHACPKTFEGRKDAKYCSGACRERTRRRRLAAGVAAGTEEESAAVVGLPVRGPDVPPKPLVAAVEKQLRKAERLETVAGQMAMVLAERLAAGLDTGSAQATLSRELTARMAEALAGATIEPDELDELAIRRLKKVSGA